MTGANRRGRDIERSGLKPPGRELFGIVTEPTAYLQRGLSLPLARYEAGIRAEIGPRDYALALCGLPIEGLKPSSGIAFREVFGGQFPRA